MVFCFYWENRKQNEERIRMASHANSAKNILVGIPKNQKNWLIEAFLKLME